MTDIRTIEFIFLLLLIFIVVFGQLSRRIKTPYPIVMIVGGLLLGLIPGIPRIALNPDLIFLVVLPPLLYSSAWLTSWRDFRYNLVGILSLAFGLVGFTVLGVALITPHVLFGFDWRLGLVLGAIVAPTDAIAATSIAKQIGLPARIVDILEGESLINDATGLLALQFATALIVSGTIPTVFTSLLTLAWLTLGGIAIGLAIAWIVLFAEKRINDGPIEIALSIVVPYGAYFAADSVRASGVLAVVACGLVLTRRSHELFSSAVRIQIFAFWQSLTFVLNGLVFVLIGLQLPFILRGIRDYSVGRLMLDGAVFSLLLIALRMIWVFPGVHIAHWIRSRFGHQTEPPVVLKQVFVVGWTGMRGVVSLAAALSLPTVLSNGNAFPERDMLVFLTFCVILVTLVLQGITLAPLVKALGLAGAYGPDCEELEARRLTAEAAVAYLEGAKQKDPDDLGEIYEDILGHYRQRLATLQDQLQGQHNRQQSSHHERATAIVREAAHVERDTAVRLRNEGRINDTVLRRIERELDLNESRFSLGEGD